MRHRLLEYIGNIESGSPVPEIFGIHPLDGGEKLFYITKLQLGFGFFDP